MARLQFRHKSMAFSGRTEAMKYLSDLVDSNNVLSLKFKESLIGEPLVVKYLDDNEKEQMLLAIGMSGEIGESALTSYHIIDSAKYEEDITTLSGLTEELKEQIEAEIGRLDDLAEKVDALSGDVHEIKESYIKAIDINDDNQWEGETGKPTSAVVENNVAKIELTTDHVRIADGFEGSFIHHDHALTDFLKSMEDLKVVKIPQDEIHDPNVRDAYKLVISNQTLGDIINIYKDSSLKSVDLVNEDDHGNKGQYLKFTYILANGSEDVVYVNVSEFLTEKEFQSGVTADVTGIVHGVVDPQSETFLTVGGDGFKLSGVQNAINTAVETETTRATTKENELQSELDKTQEGAGLASDGSYVHDHPTNYLGEATSLAEADHALDAALKSVEDKVDGLSASTESFISNTNEEISRLDTKIEGETRRATEKENELDAKIDSTTSNLETKLNKEIADRRAVTGQDGDVYQPHNIDPSDLAYYIKTADSLDSADMILDSKLHELSGAVESEISERQNADSALSDAITAETERATARENDIEDSLNLEKDRAEQAENELNTKIDSVKSELVSSITAETERATARENEIADDLTQEIADRAAADTALSNRITSLESGEITGKEAIKVTETGNDNEVELLISPDDKVLTQNILGLKTNLSISIENEVVDDINKEFIVLRGVDNELVARADASRFIKDGMISNVELVNNVLIITFNTDAGKDPSVISIPLTDLIDVYTVAPESQSYLRLNNNEFSVNVGSDGLAKAVDLTILSGKVGDTVAQLYGNYTKTGSIKNVIEETFSAPVTHTPIGDQSDADNNNLLRYYKPQDGADGDIRYYVSNKTSDMRHGDENLADYLDSMQDDLQNEIDRAIARENEIESALTQETIDRTAADDELWAALSAETAERIAGDNELNDKLAQEIIDRQSGDTVLWEALSAETVERIAADEELDNKLAQEIIDRQSGDTMLWEALSAETAERKEADQNIINNINQNLFGDAEYVESAKTICFYNKLGEVIDTIDATDFIKDGMVDSVTVDTASGGTHSGETCLIITFNEGVEGQKEDIYIPLTSIFDPSNYYNKTEADEKFLTQEVFNEKEYVIAQALNDINDRIDTVSGDTSGLDGLREELRQLSAATEDGLEDLNDKIDELSGSVIENYITKEAYEIDEKVIAEAFNDLNDRLLDLSGVTKDGYYTKDEVNQLLNNLSTTILSSVKAMFIGTDKQIKITESGDNMKIGFADNAIFGEEPQG